jgi:diaminohydroxyphosphoribosylaminopyrimidine deaminase/5-amino-6-(5-phosphoribosylamino)uracil reductase
VKTKSDIDLGHMRAALGLARRGLGQVWPNPAVGCVIARDGRVVGRGWTQKGGRPHAETEALRRAGSKAQGATAYVTLEPCAHHGQTPPCADALINAGIARVVIALADPDPRVDGAGRDRLEKAGINVVTGVCEREAAEVNAGFLLRIREGRPLVTLKAATSLDGRIATQSGDSQWITGVAARRSGHLMRACHDAILVGARTASEDNPSLTCRIEGLEDRSPVRIVVDGRMRLPLTHTLVATASETPTWLFTFAQTRQNADRRRAYATAGVELFDVAPDVNGNPDIEDVLHQAAERGITRLLVEGGGVISAVFLSSGLVDEINWFRAPSVIGGDGIAAIGGFGAVTLRDTVFTGRISVEELGDDVLERYSVMK